MLPLEAVLKYYNLLRYESKYKIVCPFHEDVNASLQIDLDKQFWFCFGCQIGGGSIEFVKYAEDSLNDMQVHMLHAKITKNCELKGKSLVKQRSKAIESDADLYLAAQDYYFNLKSQDWEVDNDPDVEYMIKRGFTRKVLTECGMKLAYNNNYPIVFPMYDEDKFRGWVRRTTNLEIEKDRKYLYNKGFSRRDTIVGDYHAKVVMIVEGYMDRLKAIQFGMKYVGAILGWKITEEQIQKLKDAGVEEIISGLDNDECGKKGTRVLRQHFKVTRFQFKKGIKDIGQMDQALFDKCKKKTMEKRRKDNG